MIKDRSSPPIFFCISYNTYTHRFVHKTVMMMGKACPLRQALGPTFYPNESLHGPVSEVITKGRDLISSLTAHKE